MSSDVKHVADELGLETQDTQNSDVSTDAADDTTNQDGGEQTADLDLSEGPSKKDIERAKMVEAFGRKILLGAMTINDLPKDQQWLAKEVEAYVTSARQRVEVERPDPKQIAREVREDFTFDMKAQEIRDADLGAELNKSISEKYKYYREKGFSKLDALTESLEFNKVDLKKKAEIPSIRTGGGPSRSKEVTVDDLSVDEINNASPAQLARLRRS